MICAVSMSLARFPISRPQKYFVCSSFLGQQSSVRRFRANLARAGQKTKARHRYRLAGFLWPVGILLARPAAIRLIWSSLSSQFTQHIRFLLGNRAHLEQFSGFFGHHENNPQSLNLAGPFLQLVIVPLSKITNLPFLVTLLQISNPGKLPTIFIVSKLTVITRINSSSG